MNIFFQRKKIKSEFLRYLSILIHTYKINTYEGSKKSLQREEIGSQGKAERGRSRWLKSKEDTDVAVRSGLRGSRVRS